MDTGNAQGHSQNQCAGKACSDTRIHTDTPHKSSVFQTRGSSTSNEHIRSPELKQVDVQLPEGHAVASLLGSPPHTASRRQARLPFRELGPLLCTLQVTLDDDQLPGHLQQGKHNTHTPWGLHALSAGLWGRGLDPSAPKTY